MPFRLATQAENITTSASLCFCGKCWLIVASRGCRAGCEKRVAHTTALPNNREKERIEMKSAWNWWKKRALGAASAVGLALLAAPADADQAYLLDKAAEITPLNDNLVALDDTFMWSAHNSFNPHEWADLSEVLDSGVRTLELDFYNHGSVTISGIPGLDSPTRYRIRGVPANGLQQVFDDMLARVIGGQPIHPADYEGTNPLSFNPVWRPLRFGTRFVVKHDPGDEDRITRIAELVGDDWLDAIGLDGFFDNALEYGNNCGDGPVPGSLAGLGGSLAPCLFEIRRWSASHQGSSPANAHLPIIVRLNIKTNFTVGTVAFLDAIVRGALGDSLITPDEVKNLGVAPGTYATLRQRVQAIGWPTMRQLRGRVLVLTYLAPGFRSNPDNQQGVYVRDLLQRGFEPALFPCPEAGGIERAPADDMADVVRGAVEVGRTTDSDPIRRAAAGYTACYTLQNNYDDDSKIDAYVRHPHEIVALLNEAERRNFLTEVWSYADIGYTTNYGGLMHRYLKHGVTFLERERLGLAASYFPKVGLDSITDYAFSIRPLDNPALALTAVMGPTSGGMLDLTKASLEPYTGGAYQHWVLREDNKLEAVMAVPGSTTYVQGTNRCLWRPDAGGHEDGHAWPKLPSPFAVMPCDRPYAGGYVNLETMGAGAGRIYAGGQRTGSFGQGHSSLYLTPDGYTKGVGFSAKPWTDEAFNAAQSGGTLGPANRWGHLCGIRINDPCPPASIRQPVLGLLLDCSRRKPFGHAVEPPDPS